MQGTNTTAHPHHHVGMDMNIIIDVLNTQQYDYTYFDNRQDRQDKTRQDKTRQDKTRPARPDKMYEPPSKGTWCRPRLQGGSS